MTDENMIRTFETELTIPWYSFINGAIAGMIATLPMTLFMLLVGRLLPKWQHYNLPPEEITDELAERAGMKEHMDKPERVTTALIAHVGYGTAMGTIYPLFAKSVSFPAMLKGTVFGLGVWAVSYLGLLPVLEMRTTVHHEPLQRNLLLIGAHIIWGATLGITEDTSRIEFHSISALIMKPKLHRDLPAPGRVNAKGRKKSWKQ
jgi:putative membrane protein